MGSIHALGRVTSLNFSPPQHPCITSFLSFVSFLLFLSPICFLYFFSFLFPSPPPRLFPVISIYHFLPLLQISLFLFLIYLLYFFLCFFSFFFFSSTLHYFFTPAFPKSINSPTHYYYLTMARDYEVVSN